MDVIPAIDLLGGQAVRLTQGRYDKVTVYHDDPPVLAGQWSGKAERLHVVDLEGARDGSARAFELIRRIVKRFGRGVQVGGGIRSLDAMVRYFEVGAERVVLGTVGLKQPDLLREAAQRYPGRIILAVDARGGMVATGGWLEQSETSASELLAQYQGVELAAILYTDIERDGTEVGPNVEATARLGRESGFPVIASGGVGTLDHLRALAEHSREIASAIVGRALHEGRFSLEEANLAALPRTSG